MSRATSADGTSIGYDTCGSGPAVVLVAGATQYRAIDSRTTRIAEQLAAEGFTAFVYDRRGRGDSHDTPPWSLDREVDDLDAMIQVAGGSAAIYTSSAGAAIALAAATSGLCVTALALYEPPYFAGSDRRAQLAVLEELLAHDQRDRASRYFVADIIGLPAEEVDQLARQPWWSAMVAVAPTLLYDHRASSDIETDPDWPTRWLRVSVPTIVYSGERTFPGLTAAADAVAAALPNARRCVLPGQGHGPEPEAIVPELVRFLCSITE